jgi:hypothetical protein
LFLTGDLDVGKGDRPYIPEPRASLAAIMFCGYVYINPQATA